MLCLVLPLLLAQAPRSAPAAAQTSVPAGQKVETSDGDTVFVREGARVRIVSRRHAAVRAIYDADKRFIVLLVDYFDPAKGMPDGKVDVDYRFDDVAGDWPLGARWEGSAIVDDYYSVGPRVMSMGPAGSIGLTTDKGLVQFFSAYFAPERENLFVDPRAIATVRFRGNGRGDEGARETFDQIEPRILTMAATQADARIARGDQPGPPIISERTLIGPSGSAAVPGPPRPSGNAPVRVGGNVKVPTKLVDVRPVYPPDAQAARVQGVVIIEATIAPDGTVGDARVLRSIPLLDQAALDAVKQWKFEPTIVGGTAVPVIMTVTVNFSLQ